MRWRRGEPIADEVRALIVELARNDSNWDYSSIRDRLENLGQLDGRERIEGARLRPGAQAWSADVMGYVHESALAQSTFRPDFTTSRGRDERWIG